MDKKDFNKLLNNGTDMLYNRQESMEILRAFNDIIHGLYHIGSEERYIFATLNTPTYIQEEYGKLIDSIGIGLADIANKLEIARSLLFGDCFNWDYIQSQIAELTDN